ncbi:MAG: hypothetical protein KAH09_00065 [Desulfobacula sp.]|nr:hypothetical protein [Desulfobacula sp.]
MRKINGFFCIALKLLWVFIFLISFIPPCYAKEGPYVPEVLQPWVDWVLHDKEDQLYCIPQYNDADIYQCAWPSELEVVLNDTGGKFKQSWLVHKETWVALPGKDNQWPGEVQVDGEVEIIIEKDKTPGIRLEPGSHRITGGFTWSGLPENLQIPIGSALVSVTVNNEKIEFPNIDGSGQLWLKSLRSEDKIENRLKIESFRLIKDSIPARVLLYFTLDVAGSAREITLGPLYTPEKLIPLSLKSPLPAKLEQDGRMVMQVRPGQYRISLVLRHTGPMSKLLFSPPANGFWPQQEIWSFSAQPDLRLVEIEGVQPIDPLQASVPKNWIQFPAYQMLPNDSMGFKEIKRGDPYPAPDQLTLDRSLWLRFDGSGYTIQDNIKGRKNTNWRLEIDPAISLGRVAVDGAEQVITRRKGSEKSGVELRNGVLRLKADSIYQRGISTLPATGWDHDFQRVKAKLYLPPGWKLLHATGIDNISRTWVKQWTLLDFFVVLIFTIALARLFSKSLAGLAFLTLVLTYHDLGAPRFVWLALLIGFALLKYLPKGKFKNTVTLYHGIVVLSLVVIVIPYAVQALRIGIYPQLARPFASMNPYASPGSSSLTRSPQMDMVQEMQSKPMVVKSKAGAGKALNQRMNQRSDQSSDQEMAKRKDIRSKVQGAGSFYYGSQVMQHDPKALTQTGPGMPRWLPFETINFSWSGPVTRDQMVSFTLMGPRINLILAFVRVFFILFLALGMFGFSYGPGKGFTITGLKSLKIFSLLFLFVLSPVLAQTSEIPSQQMLNTLEERLLEKEDCFPLCSNISNVYIRISHEQLSMDVHVDAQIDTAIPVPSHVKQWLPKQVMIDNIQAQGLLRKKNSLWMLIPAGRHVVTLSGPIGKQNLLQLPFLLKPHKVSIKADGWSVEGVNPDNSMDTQLQFKRITEKDDNQPEILETGILPPFVRVERNILLGLVWKIQTKIQRTSPTGAGVVLDIPLLPGESVTTQGIRVVEGNAKINLDTNQTHLFWESFLEPSDQILLEHKKTNTWTEIWKVDVSPIFHLEYEGIPVILHKTGTRWYPTWHPWPGEAITLKISRPPGIEGKTLTIEKSLLELRPGRKTTAARMIFSIKSSQGGHHTIALPFNAKLQEVKIKGKIQPIRQEGQNLVLPIIPGQQNIELTWIEEKGMKIQYRSSHVDLGAPSVNAGVDIYLPSNRWILFLGGEHLVGPAVLFWSMIIVLMIIAWGLSKTGWAQLRIYHWFFLGIGMSMSNQAAGLIVVGWLIALDLKNKAENFKGFRFDLIQIGIVVLTIAAMGSLVFSVSQGLLGHPDMNIVGNGSNGSLLRWYQDVSNPILPRAWVFSIPMLIYRAAMLAWALWLSFWLLGILQWGWKQFITPTIWYGLSFKIKRKQQYKKEEK